jgi:hypothetical protein
MKKKWTNEWNEMNEWIKWMIWIKNEMKWKMKKLIRREIYETDMKELNGTWKNWTRHKIKELKTWIRWMKWITNEFGEWNE